MTTPERRVFKPQAATPVLERQSARYSIPYADGSGDRLAVSFDRNKPHGIVIQQESDVIHINESDDVQWLIKALQAVHEDFHGKPKSTVAFRASVANLHDGRGPG